jgi:serine/threonine-protein kinase
MSAESADSNPPGEMYCSECERTYAGGEHCPADGKRLVRLATRIDPFLGRELDGRYTILEKLGQGGMGAVYRANQHSVGREVAIKVVNAHLISDPDMIKRFLREAKIASRLSHPNAVGVLDFGQTDDGVFYLVLELVDGRTLDEVIAETPRFSPERVIRIGQQICDALDCAHGLSIVHRDLKPANIMLLSRGRDLVKVLDFGLAKSVAPDQTSTTMTGAGAMLGTPAFMPPELATGQACDGRADLYALGCILYLIGSGRLPFESESVHELIAMHGSERPPVMPGVPGPLARVVAKLLEKAPADRYQTAIEVREALEGCLDLARTPIPDGSLTTRYTPAVAAADTLPPQPRHRRRWPWLVGGLAAIGMVVIAIAASSTTESSIVLPPPAPVLVAPAPPPRPVENVEPPKIEPPKIDVPAVVAPAAPDEPKSNRPPHKLPTRPAKTVPKQDPSLPF